MQSPQLQPKLPARLRAAAKPVERAVLRATPTVMSADSAGEADGMAGLAARSTTKNRRRLRSF